MSRCHKEFGLLTAYSLRCITDAHLDAVPRLSTLWRDCLTLCWLTIKPSHRSLALISSCPAVGQTWCCCWTAWSRAESLRAEYRSLGLGTDWRFMCRKIVYREPESNILNFARGDILQPLLKRVSSLSLFIGYLVAPRFSLLCLVATLGGSLTGSAVHIIKVKALIIEGCEVAKKTRDNVMRTPAYFSKCPKIDQHPPICSQWLVKRLQIWFINISDFLCKISYSF